MKAAEARAIANRVGKGSYEAMVGWIKKHAPYGKSTIKTGPLMESSAEMLRADGYELTEYAKSGNKRTYLMTFEKKDMRTEHIKKAEETTTIITNKTNTK